jgi:hypothetical protein
VWGLALMLLGSARSLLLCRTPVHEIKMIQQRMTCREVIAVSQAKLMLSLCACCSCCQETVDGGIKLLAAVSSALDHRNWSYLAYVCFMAAVGLPSPCTLLLLHPAAAAAATVLLPLLLQL